LRFVFTCIDTQQDEARVNNVTAEEGEEVPMWCPGNSVDEEIRWWRVDDSGETVRLSSKDAVLSDFEDRMYFDATTGNLTIYEVQLSDSGDYWCSVGFEKFKVQLTVFGNVSYHVIISP